MGPNCLKDLREACEISLNGLAAKVGTSNQQVSHLELGKRSLTVEWLMRLAAALDCHPWEIVSCSGPGDPQEEALLQCFRESYGSFVFTGPNAKRPNVEQADAGTKGIFYAALWLLEKSHVGDGVWRGAYDPALQPSDRRNSDFS